MRALLALIPGAFSLAPQCYVPPLIDRIVGGTDAAPREFPFLVSVRTADTLCGGALISPTWVLTAAHCGTPDWVNIGMWNMSKTDDPCVERINIIQTIPNPNYNNPARANDVMLLQLETPSTYTPAKLWNGIGNFDAAGTSLQVAGWGTTSEMSMSVSNILQKVVVPVQTNAACNAQYSGVIIDSMMCAGFNTGGKDSCRGDSGGPLFTRDPSTKAYQWLVVGVVSFGKGCAEASAYGVYSRVTSFNNWICQVSGVCANAAVPTTPPPTIKPTPFPTPKPTPQPTPFPTFKATPPPTPLPTPWPTVALTAKPTPQAIQPTNTPPSSPPSLTPPGLAPTREGTPKPTPCRCPYVWCTPRNLPVCEAPTRPPTTKYPTRSPTPKPTRPPTPPPSPTAPTPQSRSANAGQNLMLQSLLQNSNNLSPSQWLLLQQLLAQNGGYGYDDQGQPGGQQQWQPTPQPWQQGWQNPQPQPPWMQQQQSPWQQQANNRPTPNPPTNSPTPQPTPQPPPQSSTKTYNLLRSDGSVCWGLPLSRSTNTLQGCQQMCDFTPSCAYVYHAVDPQPVNGFQNRWIPIGPAPPTPAPGDQPAECDLFPAGACEPPQGISPAYPNARIYKKVTFPDQSQGLTGKAGKGKGKNGKKGKNQQPGGR